MLIIAINFANRIEIFRPSLGKQIFSCTLLNVICTSDFSFGDNCVHMCVTLGYKKLAINESINL